MVNIKKILFIALPIISSLILAGFFIFPRIPEVTISRPYITSTEMISFTSFTILVNVSIISKNYIDYHINSLKINTVSNLTNVILIGNGEIDNQNIKSMETTVLIVPILFNLTNIDLTKINCGFNGDTKNYINLDYSATVNINIISTFYTPVIKGSNSFICPF